MKTLAVIRNELFKDYLQIVSTDNLEATLDNPNVPIPFICVDSISNNNADELREQLAIYFNRAKLKNKEFFNLDETQLPQLTFMLNLIKLSSGEILTQPVKSNDPKEQLNEEISSSTNTITTENTVTITTENTVNEKIPEKQPPQQQVLTPETTESNKDNEFILELNVDPSKDNKTDADIIVKPPMEQIVVKNVEPILHEEEEAFDNLDDPFGYKNVVTHTKVEPTIDQEKTPTSVVESDELIEELGIPKNATIQFYKNDSVTAQLLDEKTVIFDGETMTLVEATKAAFKKIGTLGMAAGLPNWIYKEKTLKQWKEQK